MSEIIKGVGEPRRRCAEAHARTTNALRELDAAMEVGDRRYRRLRRRLDDYGTRLEETRFTLRHAGYPVH